LVQGALKQTLSDLRLDYLDLFMIHWPIVFQHDLERPESGKDFVSLEDQPLTDTWAAMEDCVSAGLCRNLGVCNFSVANLKTILDDCQIKPSANQVECHPLLNQRVLFDFCQANQIHFVAYSPLGSGDRPDRMRGDGDPNMFDNELLKDLAAKNKISVGELLLAWAVCRGTVAIPKSTNPQRLAQNLAAGEIQLSDDDMTAIEAFSIGMYTASSGSIRRAPTRPKRSGEQRASYSRFRRSWAHQSSDALPSPHPEKGLSVFDQSRLFLV